LHLSVTSQQSTFVFTELLLNALWKDELVLTTSAKLLKQKLVLLNVDSAEKAYF